MVVGNKEDIEKRERRESRPFQIFFGSFVCAESSKRSLLASERVWAFVWKRCAGEGFVGFGLVPRTRFIR